MTELFYDFEIYDIPEAEISLNIENAEQNLLVVAYEDDFNEHNALLFKILSAIGYEKDRNAMIHNLKIGESINLSRAVPREISNVLCFGMMPKDIGFNASFRPNAFYKTENFSVLLSYNLEKLGTSVENKRALWTALQTHFKK